MYNCVFREGRLLAHSVCLLAQNDVKLGHQDRIVPHRFLTVTVYYARQVKTSLDYKTMDFVKLMMQIHEGQRLSFLVLKTSIHNINRL